MIEIEGKMAQLHVNPGQSFGYPQQAAILYKVKIDVKFWLLFFFLKAIKIGCHLMDI